MTKNRACANSETVSAEIHPVSDLENRKVDGKALCCDRVLADELAKIDKLRVRQARFLATLPTEPQDAIDASFQILNPDLGNYIEGFEEALHLSQALAVLIGKGDFDQDACEQEAAEFVSRQIANRLEQTRSQLNYLSHVLLNPRRVARERTLAEATS